MLEDPNLVIGIGRLFVNVGNGEAGHTSKWTGYEVFVDRELALWMVFDRHSIDPRATNWYPFACRLSHRTLQDSDDKQVLLISEVQSFSTVNEIAPRFDIACLIPTLRDLANAGFQMASEKEQETIQCGEISVCQVERSEIDKLLETKLAR